jgi:hypothetical protein
MEQDRALIRIAHVLQNGEQVVEIVPIDRAHIVEAHLLEPPAEASADRYHGVVKFDVVSGVQAKAKANAPAYTRVFGESLILPFCVTTWSRIGP